MSEEKETAPQAGGEAETLRVRFDIEQLNIDDYALLDTLAASGDKIAPGMMAQVIGLLKRCGGEEIGKLPVTALPEVIDQLAQAVTELSAAKN